MQDNPFADLIPQSQAPGVIYGRPKQPTALELRREYRADEDQALQREAADRAAESAARSNANAERMVRNDEIRLSRESVSDQSGLRKEFNALPQVKEFGDVRASRQQIRSLALNPQATAQDDIAIIFSYMKMLDPGSVVREGEFATAQNAAGIPTAIQNMYNKAIDGTRLTREQRLNMAQTAENLYQTRREGYNATATQYRDLAGAQGINPDYVARRYVPDAARDQSSPVAQDRNALTASNLADFATGLSGGKYEATKDAGLTYDGQPVAASAEVLNSDRYREAYRAKFGEYPPLQVDVEGGAAAPDLTGREDAIFDPLVRGAADTLTLGTADEISAAAQTIFGGGTMRENLRNERAIDRYDEQNNFAPRLAGQIAGGFGLPIGNARSAGELARVGAAYGGGYGFGSSDGGIGDRLLGAGGGALAGGATGYGLARLGQAAAGRFGGGGGGNDPRAGGRALMEAADRQGVTVLPADVGGPMTRRFTAGAAQGPLSAGPIIRGGQLAAEQMQGARDRIAGAVGNAVDPVEAGEAVSAAARGFSGRTSARGGNLYDEAAALAGNARVDPAQARATLQQQIERMEQVPGGGAGLEQARGLLSNLEGNFTVQGIRDMRTEMFVAPELRGTPASSRLRQIVDAAAEDVASSLEAQGRGEAAAAFRRADRYWRARIETIDQTIEPIIGSASAPKSGEQVVQSLMTAGRTNSTRLNRFVQSLPADEQATLRATVISQLGRSSAGTQNAEGSAFSAQQFLTQWNQLTPRAKDVLFRGEARDALNDLARIAQGTREGQAYANRSNTGGAMNVAGLLGISFASPMVAAGAGAAQIVTGRLLASPRFARWLTRPVRNRGDVENQIRRLATIASREPAVANDLLPVQRALEQALPNVAANDQPQNRR